MKLVQKRFLQGKREFEIVEDMVNVRIRTLGKLEALTVPLAVLDHEPTTNGQFLEFHSRVNREVLLSLFRDKPDSRTFKAFVDELHRRARAAYGEFTGLRSGARAEGLAANSYEEPPDIGEPGNRPVGKNKKMIRAESIDSSIQMLQQYLDSADIEPLLAALHDLRAEPQNESQLDRLVDAFENLGPQQGAVLTYAPYIGILLSDDPFGD